QARFEQAKQGKLLLEELFDDKYTIPIRSILDHERYYGPALLPVEFPKTAVADKVEPVGPASVRAPVTADKQADNVTILLSQLRQELTRPDPETHVLSLSQRETATQSLDALLYHMIIIDHWIRTGLITDEDVLEPLLFYAHRMREDAT